MAGNSVDNHPSRDETSEHKFWLGLSDWAVDRLGATAAAVAMREAYITDNPGVVLEAVHDVNAQELAAAEPLLV